MLYTLSKKGRLQRHNIPILLLNLSKDIYKKQDVPHIIEESGLYFLFGLNTKNEFTLIGELENMSSKQIKQWLVQQQQLIKAKKLMDII